MIRNRIGRAAPRSMGRGRLASLTLLLAAGLAPIPAHADSVQLNWTAPGDDGSVGRASSYEMRYAEQPPAPGDTAGWWSAALAVSGLPAPQTAGSREQFTVSGLVTGTTYYFLVRTADEVPNWSGFSNLATKLAGGSGATLATPGGLEGHATPGGVVLSWNEPASGAGSGYRVYRRTGAAGVDSLLVTLPLGTNAYTDPAVTPGTRYEYRVATYLGSAEGTPAMVAVSIPSDGLAGTTRGIRGYPNPAHDRVTLRFAGGTADGAPGRTKIVVFDLTGRVVSRVLDEVVPPGERALEWTCRSDGGNALAPGLYTIIMDGPRGRFVERLAITP